jgi:hypothetical protein
MSLTTTFDELVTSVAQIQRKADVIMERLHEINCDVHGLCGPPDRDTLQATLDELQLDLPELSASAVLPLEACALFAAEVARLPSEEDTLHRADGAAADDAGPASEAPAASLASAEVVAWTHENHGVLRQADGAGTPA